MGPATGRSIASAPAQVEPNPEGFGDLKLKNRRSHLFGHCLSTTPTPEVVDFDAYGLAGGIIHDGRKLANGDEYDFLVSTIFWCVRFFGESRRCISSTSVD
jgi:hypothetical protein